MEIPAANLRSLIFCAIFGEANNEPFSSNYAFTELATRQAFAHFQFSICLFYQPFRRQLPGNVHTIALLPTRRMCNVL